MIDTVNDRLAGLAHGGNNLRAHGLVATIRRLISRYVYRSHRCIVTHSILAGPPADDHVGDIVFRLATETDHDWQRGTRPLYDVSYFKLLFSLAVAVVVLAGCAGTEPQAEGVRVVMSEHKAWTIRVTPSFSYGANRWRARAEVWPPDRNHQTHAGILVHFNDTAWDQRAVVEAALQSARRYIDASRSEHQ